MASPRFGQPIRKALAGVSLGVGLLTATLPLVGALAGCDSKPQITYQKNSVTCAPSQLHLGIEPSGLRINQWSKKDQHAAVLNGGFFDKPTDTTFLPTGLVIREGVELFSSTLQVAAHQDRLREAYANKARHESAWMQVIFVRQNGTAGLLSTRHFENAYRPSHYSDIRVALECGPLLIQNGRMADNPFIQSTTSVPRSAIAIDFDGNIILYASAQPQTYRQLAQSLQNLRAVDALALDGGPSTSSTVSGHPDLSVKTDHAVCTFFYVDR